MNETKMEYIVSHAMTSNMEETIYIDETLFIDAQHHTTHTHTIVVSV